MVPRKRDSVKRESAITFPSDKGPGRLGCDLICEKQVGFPMSAISAKLIVINYE